MKVEETLILAPSAIFILSPVNGSFNPFSVKKLKACNQESNCQTFEMKIFFAQEDDAFLGTNTNDTEVGGGEVSFFFQRILRVIHSLN